MPWHGGESLYEPATNIRLGTAYLRQMLDRYDGQPYLAIAAYNAGPAPVERWRAGARRTGSGLLHREHPYKETREYVARVLAFSVVYDWRLNGNAAPLQRAHARPPGHRRAQRRPFACPTATQRPGPMIKHDIVVLGGTGFVGRRLLARLLARRPSHRAAQPQPRPRTPTACCRRASSCASSMSTIPTRCARAFAGADAVINLVGILNEAGDDGRGFRRAHVELTRSW